MYGPFDKAPIPLSAFSKDALRHGLRNQNVVVRYLLSSCLSSAPSAVTPYLCQRSKLTYNDRSAHPSGQDQSDAWLSVGVSLACGNSQSAREYLEREGMDP